MKEERPNLEDIPKVKPTTGFSEGQVGAVLENKGLVSRVRRALSNIAKKTRANPESKPPLGKAF